jgi:DNA modification methylase
MVFTDPPYNVDYSGKGKNTSNKILNDNMSEDIFRTFLTDTFASYRTAMKDDGAIYVCYASRTHREFEDALNANGFKVKAQIIWVKTQASFGWADYRWKHEPILYCSVEGKKVPFYGDRKQVTEWATKPTDAELLRVARQALEEEKREGTTVWKLSREQGYLHPTQKPLELIEIALKNSTQKGDKVLDLFGGSGSTLMACQQMERINFTMELDPKYVDVVKARWEKFTGLEAIKLA